MNYLNIAILLTATTVSAASSNTPNPATVAADRSLKDLQAPLKITDSILAAGGNFYSNSIGVCNNRTAKFNFNECKALYEQLKNGILAVKSEAFAKIAEENSAITYILSKFGGSTDALKSWAEVVLNSEKNDWDAVIAAINWMGNFLSSDAVQNRIDAAKYEDKFSTPKPEVLKILIPLCENGISEDQRIDDNRYKTLLTRFKSWIIAIKMFGNPAETDGSSKKVQDYTLSPSSLSDAIKKINVPADRFKVFPIEPTLNLKYIRSANGTKNSQQESSILRENFEVFKAKYKTPEWVEEMKLREIVINSLFDSPNSEPIKLNTISLRIIAFRRIVEGVIRSLQDGKNMISSNLVTKAVKAWIIAKQMVENNGWKDENIEFGVLVLPTAVTSNLGGNHSVQAASNGSSNINAPNRIIEKQVSNSNNSNVSANPASVASVSANQNVKPADPPTNSFLSGLKFWWK